MSSNLLCRASALFFGAAGLLFLFAPDLALPQLIPSFPTSGIWLGQFLGAAWLGFAALNWQSRSVLLGGIYGRAVVHANFVHWFIAAMALFGAARRPDAVPALQVLTTIVTLLAAGYAVLLFKGPFRADLASHGML